MPRFLYHVIGLLLFFLTQSTLSHVPPLHDRPFPRFHGRQTYSTSNPPTPICTQWNRTLERRAGTPNPNVQLYPGGNKKSGPWYGYVAETGSFGNVWTKATVMNIVKRAWLDADPKGKDTGPIALFAGVWIKGDGVYIFSKPRGEEVTRDMWLNGGVHAPAWRYQVTDRDRGDFVDRLHAEDGAMWYMESQVSTKRQVRLQEGQNYEHGFGIERPYIAIYGKKSKNAAPTSYPPCGPESNLINGPTCGAVVSRLHIDST